ncbi:WGR domain-containing protein [Rhizobium glycinendophyticum]|uniref:WGR domain-containing protein n=1 Tax=Rhizobium glycinendophyticum TaxID=2589807 RepID=A0A504U6C5_9HYPH|nr:WGR domain-containing protein [Rhizobium glycinendophyticum]TPP05975.1 WGR domain-containing protein [Rhizobium glycinendophyticum]
MTVRTFDAIHLHRIDPAKNMARFYLVTIEETLFGETIVRRHWGRIGTHGQSRTQLVERVEDAPVMAARLCHVKRRRGYRDTDANLL